MIINTNLVFAECANVLIEAKLAAALTQRPAHHCHIIENSNDSYQFRQRSGQAKAKIKLWEQAKERAAKWTPAAVRRGQLSRSELDTVCPGHPWTIGAAGKHGAAELRRTDSAARSELSRLAPSARN